MVCNEQDMRNMSAGKSRRSRLFVNRHHQQKLKVECLDGVGLHETTEDDMANCQEVGVMVVVVVIKKRKGPSRNCDMTQSHSPATPYFATYQPLT